MPNVKAIHAVSVRVVPVQAGGETTVGIEVISTNGEHFALTMSGEGAHSLAGRILSFLEEHPQLAKTTSPPRQ